MNTQRYIMMLVFVLLISLGPVYAAHAQTDQQVQDIKRYLNGQQILVTYREGGPVYGTHFVLEIHYCPTGHYALFGHSEKQTVLDNWQVNNWEDNGRWEVLHFQGQTGVGYVSASGTRDFVPVHLLPDGGIWVREGVSIQRQGRAQCR